MNLTSLSSWRTPYPHQRAFALLELIIASALFMMAVVALWQASLYTIEAQTLIQDSEQVRRAVIQTAEEIVATKEPPRDAMLELEDAFDGIRIKQKVDPVNLEHRNEDSPGVTNVPLLRVELIGTAGENADPAKYTLVFYVQP